MFLKFRNSYLQETRLSSEYKMECFSNKTLLEVNVIGSNKTLLEVNVRSKCYPEGIERYRIANFRKSCKNFQIVVRHLTYKRKTRVYKKD